MGYSKSVPRELEEAARIDGPLAGDAPGGVAALHAGPALGRHLRVHPGQNGFLYALIFLDQE